MPGRPILSRICATSECSVLRISPSTSPKTFSVSSTRMPAGRMNMQAELPAIDGGEEVPPDERQQDRRRCTTSSEEDAEHGGPMMQAQSSMPGIAVAELLELAVEPALFCAVLVLRDLFRQQRVDHAPARACGTGDRRRPSRRRRRAPSGRRDSAAALPGRRPRRKRYRSSASPQRSARRSAARRRGWRG